MIRRIAQAGIPIVFADLVSGIKSIFIDQEESFIEALSCYLTSKHVCLVNSGTAAFYIILKVLKEFSSKREVVLPAYSAPAVVLPVLKSGLRPILSDISLSDFNIDLGLLPKVISEDTLCVVPTHMFGIPVAGIERVKERLRDVFIIEDCAQSMGSKIKEKDTGSFSDIGFLSFNRGKNLPTYGEGCIFTDSQELAEKIKVEVDRLEQQSHLFKFILPFKMAALSLAVRPFIYGFFYPAISYFKDNKVPDEFSIRKYTNFQAGVGLSLLKRIDDFSKKRYQNGSRLIGALRHIEGIILPSVSEDSMPAFNRLPVLFKNLVLREKIEKTLWKAGIDTSRMYLKPIHHIFDLGYKKEDFPNATYCAEHLLTLPVHPFMEDKDVAKIIDVILQTVRG